MTGAGWVVAQGSEAEGDRGLHGCGAGSGCGGLRAIHGDSARVDKREGDDVFSPSAAGDLGHEYTRVLQIQGDLGEEARGLDGGNTIAEFMHSELCSELRDIS